jgi:hypothetical protein
MSIYKVAKKYCQILKQKKAAIELPTTEVKGDVDADTAKAKAGILQLTELQSAAGYLYNMRDSLAPLAVDAKAMSWTITQLYHTMNTLVSDVQRAGLHDAKGYHHYIKSLISQLSQTFPEAEKSKLNSVIESFNKWVPQNFDVLAETKFTDKKTPWDKRLVRESPYAGPDTREL